jgi:flagellar biogenesis protein FliO
MGIELGADAAEVVWGAISLVLWVALIGGVIYLVSRLSRKGRHRDERFQRIEDRLNTLERQKNDRPSA